MTSPQPPQGYPTDPSAQGGFGPAQGYQQPAPGQPYGQPAPGQPYGQPAPGQLPEGYAQAAAQAPVIAPKKGKLKKIVGGVVTLVLIVGVKVAVSDLFSDDPVHAKAGQCVKVTGGEKNPDVSIVDCGSADANYTVVSVVDNSFDTNACENVDTATAGLAQQLGSDKFVLCLADKK